MSAIDRVDRPSKRDFFENWFKPGKPVLMTGLTSDWPAMGKWTLEYLKTVGGSKTVKIEVGNILQGKTRLEEWPLAQYFEYIMNSTVPQPANENSVSDGEMPYLAFFEIFKYMPELKHDVNFSFWSGRYRAPIGWIGPAGSYSGIHLDIAPNLFAIFRGAKEFTLYSPDQTPFMYPSGKYDGGSILSSVDGKNPDYNRFPLFRKVEAVKVVVKPGDLLFTPRAWWHQVSGLEPSISVSCFAFGIKDFLLYGIPAGVKQSLHSMGLYKKGHCTCHENGKPVAKK